MSSKLFVIGNGFDCMYGLPTKVSDYERLLSGKMVYNEIDNAKEILNAYGVFWGEFEEGLSFIDIGEIFSRNIEYPDYLSDHEFDRDGGILNMQMYTESLETAVRSALDDMIYEAECVLNYRNCITKPLFIEGDQIISFNYTSTIERLYKIPKGSEIIHMHGFVGGEKIFGYKNQQKQSLSRISSEEDYYVDEQKEVVDSMYKRLQKRYKYDELAYFLNKNCQDVEEVVVIGHSMAEVDSEYMEMIETIVKPKVWRISQYYQNPNMELLNDYSFAYKISLFDSSVILKERM